MAAPASRSSRHPRRGVVLGAALLVALAVAALGAFPFDRPPGSAAEASTPAAAPRTVRFTPADARAITAFVENAMAELRLVPGVAVAVVVGDSVVYERGFGFGDVERGVPVTPATVFYTASLAKSFTGMTASVLATGGRLDLDAPLSRFFPDLRMETPLSADEISVRDLLTHSKGFTNGAVNFVTTWVGPYSDADLLRVLGRHSTPTDGGFRYSNTSYALAGYVVERATGTPWQEVMASLVFEPLGMRRSTARLSGVPEHRMARPYIARADGFQAIPFPKTDRTITGAGGIFSTAHDLARYVVANLHEGRIDGRQALPAAAVSRAHAPAASLDRTFYEFRRHAYGLGVYLADYDGDLLIHHFGGISGYRSHLSFMPERDVGVVVLQNEGIFGSRFADLVATFVYDRLLEKPEAGERARERIERLRVGAEEARRSREGWEGDLERLRTDPGRPALPPRAYAGAYENERLGRLDVVHGAGGLRVVWGDLAGPALPAGGHAFLVDWIPGLRPARFSFRAEGDSVIGFDWDFRPFRRVGPSGR